MNVTIELDELPDELTDYAFDQFEDRIAQELDSTLERLLANDPVIFDYETQSFTLTGSLVTNVLESAMMEKIRDIEHEVKHDERSDYTLDEIHELRSEVNQALNS